MTHEPFRPDQAQRETVDVWGDINAPTIRSEWIEDALRITGRMLPLIVLAFLIGFFVVTAFLTLTQAPAKAAYDAVHVHGCFAEGC